MLALIARPAFITWRHGFYYRGSMCFTVGGEGGAWYKEKKCLKR